MIQAYNSLYLEKAEKSMAMMLDYAVHDLHYDADSFFDLFLSSGIADLFGRGEVRIIAGISGVELAYRVLEESGIDADRISYRYTAGRSREYWAGWALARYQWEKALPFSVIISAAPVSKIISMTDSYRESEIAALSEGLSWMDTLVIPDHMSEDNYNSFYVNMDAMLADAPGDTALKRLRMRSGFSQSRLAAISGVPVRTIQQYEQRQKDISKAGFASIIKLAAVLSCEPYDLLDR